MCSVSLIAIELKGLSAPGEALKINVGRVRISQPDVLNLSQVLQSIHELSHVEALGIQVMDYLATFVQPVRD